MLFMNSFGCNGFFFLSERKISLHSVVTKHNHINCLEYNDKVVILIKTRKGPSTEPC